MMNEKIAILVDSGTDVPREVIDNGPFFMVPLRIIFSDREYRDGIDISSDTIFPLIKKELPTTSLPDGELIHQVFDDIKEQNLVDAELFYHILKMMVEEQGADVVILGCTELSYAQEMAHDHSFPVADSQSVLVDKSIEMALKLRK